MKITYSQPKVDKYCCTAMRKHWGKGNMIHVTSLMGGYYCWIEGFNPINQDELITTCASCGKKIEVKVHDNA